MNSRQIEYFVTVAKYLNFTKAGEKLYASQSTVSRQISLLEEELGFPLLSRGHNFVRLTAAGAIMLDTFEQINSLMERQIQLARDSNFGRSGHLVVAFLCNMNMDHFFVNFLKPFTLKYPDIEMEYVCLPSGGISDALLNGRIDVVFTHNFNAPKSRLFITDAVCALDTFLIYGHRHPLAARENLTFQDFQDEYFWTAAESDTDERKELLKKFSEFYNIENLKTKTTENFETALLNVRLGKGVAFADDISIFLPDDIYGKLPLDQSISRIEICVTWNRENLNPAAALFVDQIISRHEEEQKITQKKTDVSFS